MNTDIAVLTVFADLKAVAVYSVYNMVVAQMQHFIASFATGMEALFGDMIAKDEIQELHRTFEKYELLISIITVVLFSVTAVMVVPFIKIYTMGVNDANYVEPVFALLLILASIVYCLRMPYHSMTIAAGHFKQTQVAAYGEAIINIGLSVVLVIRYGLIGVAVGTVVATTFRLLYYAFYLTKHIFCRKMKDFVKREFVNLALIFFTIVMGNAIAGRWRLKNYFAWACCSACVTVLTVIVVVGINSVFYKEDVKRLLKIR